MSQMIGMIVCEFIKIIYYVIVSVHNIYILEDYLKDKTRNEKKYIYRLY